MEAKQKMAITGTGLVAAGIGLSIVGAALIAPAVFEWVTDMVEKGAGRVGAELEGASRKVGTVAGTLHRSFHEAKRAGIAELKRNSS
jgi:hypothetical protein